MKSMRKRIPKSVPFLRFEATVSLDGKVVGTGRGKSQRAAQGRASWYALVHLGEIQLEEKRKEMDSNDQWSVFQETQHNTTIPCFKMIKHLFQVIPTNLQEPWAHETLRIHQLDIDSPALYTCTASS